MKNQKNKFSLNLNLLSSVLVFLCASWLFFFTGCSSTPKYVKAARDHVKAAYEIQKPMKVVDSRMDDRPEWTKQTVFEDEDLGMIYFSGGFQNGSDYSVTIRCANAEALKVAVQAISQFIRAEFSSYVRGSNTGDLGVDRYVSDGIASFTDNLHVQGVRQKGIYYEEMFSPSIMQPTYNVWVQLEMAKVDYLKAKVDAIRRLRDKFNQEGRKEAKEKADEILKDLKEQVRNET